MSLSAPVLAVIDCLSSDDEFIEEPQHTVAELMLDNVTTDAEALELAKRLSAVATALLKALEVAVSKSG